MTEKNILNKTYDLLIQEGSQVAYDYLTQHLDQSKDWSSQVYNYLYCLAATCHKEDQALQWLKEAIVEKGLWYRPEVFEDEDLDALRDNEDFLSYQALSAKKYQEALAHTKTLLDWEEKTHENLLLVLHGNQQNNDISRSYWDEISLKDYQLAYLQSSELDSCNLYRWSDQGDGPIQLMTALTQLGKVPYKRRILSGFSAGCNTILRTLVKGDVQLDHIVLFAPWIPMLDQEEEALIRVLKEKQIGLTIVCGTEDLDCLPRCKTLEKRALEAGLAHKAMYPQGLGHDYPATLEDIVKSIL